MWDYKEVTRASAKASRRVGILGARRRRFFAPAAGPAAPQTAPSSPRTPELARPSAGARAPGGMQTITITITNRKQASDHASEVYICRGSRSELRQGVTASCGAVRCGAGATLPQLLELILKVCVGRDSGGIPVPT